jgi:O-antigen ligase
MSQELSRAQRRTIEWTIISTAVLCTLFVWSPAADPINLPKFVLLSLGSSILAGLILIQLAQSFRLFNRTRVPVLLLIAFLLVLFISSVASDYPYMSFFGNYKRNYGFLSSLALAILFIAGAMVIRINSAKKYLAGLAAVGVFEALYGIAQHFGADFIQWINPYNTVVGTFGNPDFMSAVLGISSVALSWFVIDKETQLWGRISAALGLCATLLVIVFSQARQGLLNFVFGAAFLVITWIYQRSKRLALGAGVVALLGSVAGIFGMLQIGPLSTFLYKPSITFRGDYWRAGIAIFKSHPLIGVGPDRFGAYFRQYRDAKQALRRGPDDYSDAAHNVLIHIAATAGIFALLLYVLLIGSIIWLGLRALRSASGSRQLMVAAVFGAWMAYQIQSLISIDNLGIAVWGWLLGGVIVGLAQPEFAERIAINSRKRAKATAKKSEQQRTQLIGIALASLFAIISLILTGPMFGADVAMQIANGTRPATNSARDLAALKSVIMRVPDIRPSEPYYAATAAYLLVHAELIQDAQTLLKKDLRMDPRDFNGWFYLAQSYEITNQRAQAVLARQRMAKLDPFNYVSLLELGRDLKAAGDVAGAKAIGARINSFAADTAEAKSAQAEFGG